MLSANYNAMRVWWRQILASSISMLSDPQDGVGDAGIGGWSSWLLVRGYGYRHTGALHRAPAWPLPAWDFVHPGPLDAGYPAWMQWVSGW